MTQSVRNLELRFVIDPMILKEHKKGETNALIYDKNRSSALSPIAVYEHRALAGTNIFIVKQ